MNKQKRVILICILITILLAIIVLCSIYIVKNNVNKNNMNIYDDISNKKEEESKTNSIEISITDESKYTTYTFDTDYGKVKIVADKAVQARGTEGASNNIFYLKDSNLYLCKDSTGVDRKYANGVDDIYYKNDKSKIINVKLNSSSTLNKENTYLKYIE